MNYIIIINYNNSNDTIECIQSLQKAKGDFRVIIVDNGSRIDDYNLLSDFIKSIEIARILDENLLISSDIKYILIQSIQNLGFAGGNNLAIKWALTQPDLSNIILLNNDTIVHPDFLIELILIQKRHQNIHLLGGRIFFDSDKNRIWYDGGKYNKWTSSISHINENKSIKTFENDKTLIETEFITGCLILISKEAIDKLGLLDESFFMYSEDLDYCLKAKKNGFKLYQTPNSIIWHKIGASTGGKLSTFGAYWLAKNRMRIAIRHGNFFIQTTTLLVYLFTRIPRFIKWILIGHPEIIKYQTMGLIDSFRTNKSFKKFQLNH